ncbi:MAG: hypothetical protein BWK73_42005 [Thiothrix lacustris]|uniref:Uncharacterized protein n=1 Tax=Thiothrix lacustris TaxID=525917 RepID=A0A1Y1QCM8_9GAMM|nr:MAG: hypothetical protein BWK73_42005 [Thiothrix lacustris]
MQHTTNTAAPAFNAGLAYSEFQQRKAAYIIAAITAFLMSAYFVVGYFAGHLRIWEWDGSQWAQAVPSIGLVGVMTAYQFFLYSQGDVAGGKKATYIAVFVAVAFSLLSEIGQGMERDNIRMETKSQQSPTYLATLEAIKGATGASYNPYAADLQTAQMKLAQCQQRMAQGKEKHCEGSKARVDAVNQMIATSNASSQQRALALASTAKTMEKDETNYHPLVNFIRETLGATGTIASFMLSLTLISFFEYAFHYLGGQFAKARAHLMNHGYDVTRKLRQPPRRFDGSITTYHASNTGNAAATHNAPPVAAFADSARQTVSEYATKAAENIATENAKAQYARANAYNVAGDALDSAVLKVSGGFKQSPEQRQNALNLASMANPASALVSGNKDKTLPGSTYREALRNGSQRFEDVPLDQLTQTATLPHDQRNGATGAHNPALGTQEEQHALPLLVPTPSTSNSCVQQPTLGASSPTSSSHVQQPTLGASSHDAELLAAIKEAKQSVSSEVLKESVTLYPVWRANVVAQTITPAKKPAHALMSEHWCRGGKAVTPTPPQMDKVWAIWQARAAKEGILKDNPTFKPGNRQARYVLAG